MDANAWKHSSPILNAHKAAEASGCRTTTSINCATRSGCRVARREQLAHFAPAQNARERMRTALPRKARNIERSLESDSEEKFQRRVRLAVRVVAELSLVENMEQVTADFGLAQDFRRASEVRG